MKKTYLLKVDGKNRDRLLDASKHDIRKYIKRERSKPLPEGADFWDFDCRCGHDEVSATAIHAAELFTSIDALVGEGDEFYVELVARPAQRVARPRAETQPDGGPLLA